MRSGKDNRKYPRTMEDLELWYSVDESANKQVTCSRDFSATGLCFQTEKPLAVGTLVFVEIFLKHTDRVISTRATVLRNSIEGNSNMVSVQFYDIDYHDFITLLDYSLTYHI